ncbi:cell division protein FtsZ [Pararhizobium mangrovi]|uniref:Cell division protein FtsZ n=1 Tax=Pararhizobium mangrovi TaxID=2590452 RepID=A0A506U5Z2_9HYPH|nr:cell division protein FtsZ [Pararhizobium mangrovi]TPW29270.1 cell division protein FtsZ [Pararhizobium mangrovi]
MTINLQKPDITELKPRITVFGVGGGGGNAVNNMINAGLQGVDFVVANTDAQALSMTRAERVIQMGVAVTEGLGAGSQPEVGRAAAEECIDEIVDHLQGTHMCFVTAGMGGGTGTGAAPVVAGAARNKGILTVGVVTKPFHFEGQRRMRLADSGIEELQKCVDTLIVIPNQNLFRIANDKTTFADAFGMADQVLYSGVACITDLMVKEGLINLDFADVRSVMREMGRAMMGTGEASGEGRAMAAAEAAIANPLLDETSMKGAQGLLISITGGRDLTLFEVDEAATRIREEVDPDANIILGATFDEELEGLIRVSVVATGIDREAAGDGRPAEVRQMVRPQAKPVAAPVARPAAPVQETAVASEPTPAPQADPIADAIRGTSFEDEFDVSTVIAEDAELHANGSQGALRPQNRLPAQHGAGVQQQAAHPAYGPESEPRQANHAGPRMPNVEDFPPVVKAESESRGGQAEHVVHEDRGAKGLLKRISNSFARREDDEGAHGHHQGHHQGHATSPAPAQQTRQLSPEASVYAPRTTNRGEGPQRPVPANHQSQEDDQLEIPAFLRRQSS